MKLKSYSHGFSSYPLLSETIGENLLKTCIDFPGRDALICVSQNYSATYSELWQQVTSVAKALIAIKVKKGDRVGIWSPNRFEWVLVQYATARIGAVLVNINPAYRSSELAYVLRQADVATLFLTDEFKTSRFFDLVAEVCPELAGSQPGELRAAACPALRRVASIHEQAAPGMYRWSEVLAAG